MQLKKIKIKRRCQEAVLLLLKGVMGEKNSQINSFSSFRQKKLVPFYSDLCLVCTLYSHVTQMSTKYILACMIY